MFRVKVRIDPALLAKHAAIMKTGVPGIAYVRLGADVEWPSGCACGCRMSAQPPFVARVTGVSHRYRKAHALDDIRSRFPPASA